MTGPKRSNLAHAVRVAGLATAIVTVCAVVVVGVFDLVVAHRLISQADNRLAGQLAEAQKEPNPAAADNRAGPPDLHFDVDDAPVFVWQIGAHGTPVSTQTGAPVLPKSAVPPNSAPMTATVGAEVLRLEAVNVPGGRLVAGVSLASERHIHNLLLEGELLAVPILALGMFLGSLLIGIKASAPVVVARRRQMEFTADASHELRTPLTVIEAEVDLALRQPREAAAYRDALVAIGGESERLAHIVEDLLWLARFDSMPPPPAGSTVDLAEAARQSAARFSTRAEARSLDLECVVDQTRPAIVEVPSDWMDRLAGVLLDNACRYAHEGGRIEISVAVRVDRVSLSVDDDGPGIAPEDRPRLFDRFHRATDQQGGTGLGLAIADSIVRTTGGRWTVGDSRLGGAHMEVSWPSSHLRVRRQPQPRADSVEQEQPQRNADGDRRRHDPLAH